MSRSEPLERADVSQTAPATADRPTFASASNCGGGALSAAFFHRAGFLKSAVGGVRKRL
jgi:hypothetical protein